MNRLLKFIMTLLVVVVLLGVATTLLLPRFIDPNNYRDDIAKLVYEKSGLTLYISGPIGWSIFPWVGLSLEDVTVKGNNDVTLAELGEAEISVKVMPLLSKQVEMQTLRIQGLKLSLVKDHSGKGNWDVEKPATAVKEEPAKPLEESPAKKNALPVQLNIASVEVSDLQVHYEDQQQGVSYRIDQASLTTGPIRNQDPVEFQLQSRIQLPDHIFLSSMSGAVQFNLEEELYTLNKLNISAHPDVDKPETLSIVGDLSVQKNPLKVIGTLDVPTFNLRNLLSQLKIVLPPMAKDSAMSSLAFSSRFVTDGKEFKADNLSLKLDDFNVSGQFQITDLTRQSMTFRLNGNDLNLDHYLPPVSNEPVSESGQKDQPVEESAPVSVAKEQPLIPEELLRNLTLDGSMKLASLTVAQLRFDQPSVEMKAANGQQKVSIGSGFYQGKIDLDTRMDVRKQGTPRVNVTADLKSINLEAMAEPIPALKSVQGAVNASLKTSTQGQLQSTLTRNLNGQIQFKIDKGAFTDANFDKLVCQGIATIRKTKLSEGDWEKGTHFKDLSGTFVIKNGVASNSNLIASLSHMNLKGDGQIDLVNQSLDYHMGLNIRGDESPNSDPACQVNKDYVDVTWPVRCQGPLGTQKCGVDTARLADTIKGLATSEVKKRVKEEIEDKVKGPVKDLLKGFFK